MAIIYVDASATESGQTGSLGFPFVTITAAVSAAGSDDVIHVAAGTYAATVPSISR